MARIKTISQNPERPSFSKRDIAKISEAKKPSDEIRRLTENYNIPFIYTKKIIITIPTKIIANNTPIK